MIKTGCCGWAYLKSEDFKEKVKDFKWKTKLQLYAKLFDLVEINSTFYRIPKLSTVEKWREEADEVNKNFEFTIKCSGIITHRDRFSSELSVNTFNQMVEIANTLRANILLLQSPASYKPTKESLEKVENFFKKVDKQGLRDNLTIVWEVRWHTEWTKEIVQKLFSELGIEHCVDPLRQECFYSKKVLYYRLHGFGKPMYNYKFSDEELKKVTEKCMNSSKDVYVLFNNATCYSDGLRFMKLLKESH
jgi:uncharacterized protein YecE (DUF72 family)